MPGNINPKPPPADTRTPKERWLSEIRERLATINALHFKVQDLSRRIIEATSAIPSLENEELMAFQNLTACPLESSELADIALAHYVARTHLDEKSRVLKELQDEIYLVKEAMGTMTRLLRSTEFPVQGSTAAPQLGE